MKTAVGACAVLLAIPASGFNLSPSTLPQKRLSLSSLKCQSDSGATKEVKALGRRAVLAGILGAGAPAAMAADFFGLDSAKVGWGETSKGWAQASIFARNLVIFHG